MTTTDRIWAGAFVVLWSSGFIGAELATAHASALTVLNWRFLLLAAPSALWLLARRPRFAARDVAVHAAIGLLAQVSYLYGVVAATQFGVSPGTTALIASFQPAVTAMVAYFVLSERVRGVQIVGLAIGFLGVALVVSADYSGTDAALWAFALPIGAMLSLVAGTILERRTRPQSLGPLDALAVQFLIAAAAFTALAASTGEFAPTMTPGFWGAMAWVTILSGLGGYGAYWAVVRRNGATAAATLLYLTPPVTMLWAWAMFATPVHVWTWSGLAVTGVGVALTLKRVDRGRSVRAAPVPVRSSTAP
ncbi:DMT family transporter [Glycomyces tarimensis]